MAGKTQTPKTPAVSKAPAQRQSKPATTPEGREQQMVSLAVDLAERQLRDGTASAAVISHYLKIASRREVLERDILERQAKLIDAKAENINKDNDMEKLTKAAMEAMKTYNPK